MTIVEALKDRYNDCIKIHYKNRVMYYGYYSLFAKQWIVIENNNEEHIDIYRGSSEEDAVKALMEDQL